MCKCCQLCWEDLYWQCFEEKYCYDESIANYDPNEDEYFRANGRVINGGETLDNNNQPITVQPSRLQRNISTNSALKVHEDDVRREIQTANVNLPPEIVQVFANSQIFHDHKPKAIIPQSPASFSIGAVKIEKNIERAKLEQINEDSNKLLRRLEEQEDEIHDKLTPPRIIETPAILEEEDEDEIDNQVVLRPNRLKLTATAEHDEAILSNVVNKRLQLDSPYFISRPASENDIFTISKSSKDRPTLQSVSSTSDVANRFSMTPEVPSISFATLPKNYLDTPTVEKFKKQEMTLTELQAKEAELHRNEPFDFAMPRYYGKSDIILNSSNLSISSVASTSSLAKKYVEKSKRLKALRAHIPPLAIHTKDKQEKEKEK